jgi:hypothetical protein
MKLLRSRANKLTHEELRREWEEIKWNGDTISEFTKMGCRNKDPYDSRDDAMRAIKQMMDDSCGGVVGLRPYKCKHCKKFHLTSSVN